MKFKHIGCQDKIDGFLKFLIMGLMSEKVMLILGRLKKAKSIWTLFTHIAIDYSQVF